MGQYSILKNTSLVVIATDDYADQGWEVSGNIAYHSGCNSGYIKSTLDLSTASVWTFKYTILALASGTVNIVVDGVNGVSRTEAGTYEETFTENNPNTVIQFYATGVSSLQLLQVYPEASFVIGTTLAFNEDADKWVTYYSYVPEFMMKFINGFFTFRDGRLWEHNVNEVRNNFYGVQYNSEITFYCNLSPTEVKNFHSMRQKSNHVWSVPDIEVPPRYGKPNGQKSRLKKGRFKRLQGDNFADFLRDINDDRFETDIDALMRGAELQGNLMKITIRNADTVETRLTSIDIIVSLSQYTY